MMTRVNIKYKLNATENSKWNTLRETLVTSECAIIPEKET